jgi:hypothetical protein
MSEFGRGHALFSSCGVFRCKIKTVAWVLTLWVELASHSNSTRCVLESRVPSLHTEHANLASKLAAAFCS